MDHEPTQEQCEQGALDAIREIRAALDGEDVTAPYLAKKLKSELNARKVETFKGKILLPIDPNDPASKLVECDQVIYSKSLVDWKTRQTARMDAHKLRGDYPPEEHKIGGNGKPIDVNHRLDPGGALQTVIDRLAGATRQPPTNGDTG